MVKMGNVVIAQDKETSVVWGMPGMVAKARICSAILPLNKIASFVEKL
jgi:two-component system chemotaxis response regulator CheB